MNDSPIHLKEYVICENDMYTEPSVTVPVWITQSALDGLNALIRFHEGMERAGQGTISGSFELVTFYRTLRSSIISVHNAEMEKRLRAADSKSKSRDIFELYQPTKIGGTTYEDGWYFWDECGQVGGGPYESAEDAKANLAVYVEHLKKGGTGATEEKADG